VVGNILGDHTACADHHIRANGHTGQDNCISADPHIAAHCNGLCILQKGIAHILVDGMVGGVKAAVGGDKYIIPKGDLAGVNKDAVVVGIEIIPGFNIKPNPQKMLGST